MHRIKILKTASYISIFGNSALAVMKIITGITAGSLAVLGDGFDSLTDIFISLITLLVSIIISNPPDKEHPYGHYRAETLATTLLAFIMFFIGGQFGLSTLDKLLYHRDVAYPDKIAIYVTIISIIGKILLSWSQYHLGKKAGSELLLANSKNMLNDVITSSGVLVGLAALYIFHLPEIDIFLALLISLWIMFNAIKILKSTITELMEGVQNKNLYQLIFTAAKTTKGVINPHRVRIRKLGVMFVIDMDIETDGNLRVFEAHQIALEIEEKIKKAIPNVYDIVIHIEPIGNIEDGECYGLNPKNLD